MRLPRARLSRRAFLQAAAAASAPLALTACRPPQDDGSVSVWHTKSGPERALLEAAAREFEAARPGIRVRLLQKSPEELRNFFILASVAGRGPDLVYGATDNVGVYTLTETIRPLEDVLEAEDFAAHDPLAFVGDAGKRWLAADQRGDHLVLLHDPARVPVPPATEEDMVRVAASVTDQAARRYGLAWVYAEPFFIVPFLVGHGGWLIDGDNRPTLATDAMEAVVRLILRVRNEARVVPLQSDYNIADMLFKDGSAAMAINGPWSWAGYGVGEGRSRVAPLPRVASTGLPCSPIVMARGYSVNVNVPERRLPLVRDLLRHLTSAPVQKRVVLELFSLPTHRDVLADPEVTGHPVIKDSLAAAAHGVPMPIAPQLRQVWDGMRGPLQQVAAGRLSPRDGARAMQAEAEKLIRDAFA